MDKQTIFLKDEGEPYGSKEYKATILDVTVVEEAKGVLEIGLSLRIEKIQK